MSPQTKTASSSPGLKTAALEKALPPPEQKAKAFSSLHRKRHRPGERLLYGLICFSAAAIMAMTALFIGYILWRGLPMLSWEFLTTAPNPLEDTIGILPAIIHTGYIILLSNNQDD